VKLQFFRSPPHALAIRLGLIALLSITAAPPVALAQPIRVQNLPSLGDTEREELSPLMERRLGEQVMRDIRRDRDYLDDPAVLEYLNKLGAELVAARPEARGEAGFDFSFFVVRDSALNAFALPGGFIGVYSGLLLAAQNESELASVLAHEIGHVSQRHLARMLGRQRQDSLISLAAMVLGALTAHASSDAAAALMMGGQGMAAQRQLSFSRNAEREADRVGLDILRESGFDPSGMVSFFGRLQTATRGYSDAPAYLLSHPLTTERSADIQARIRSMPRRRHIDSLDFYLARARIRVLQDATPQGLYDASVAFEEKLQQKDPVQLAAARYGLAFVALRRGNPAKAQELLQQTYAAARGVPGGVQSALLESFKIDTLLAANRAQDALKESNAARDAFPLSRMIDRQYADALIAAGRYDQAIAYLRDQAQMYRQEPQLQNQLAKAYAAQGKQALQHLALAEAYALNGSLPAALDQLAIARRAPDATYYDQTMIDARERDWKARWQEEMQENKGR
jgi:predicted Zn-dependent protease